MQDYSLIFKIAKKDKPTITVEEINEANTAFDKWGFSESWKIRLAKIDDKSNALIRGDSFVAVKWTCLDSKYFINTLPSVIPSRIWNTLSLLADFTLVLKPTDINDNEIPIVVKVKIA